MLAMSKRYSWLIAVAAILAIAANRPRGAENDADPAETHTRIVVIPLEKDGKSRPVVALANPAGSDEPNQVADTIQGILARELFRQALLIAARDELGLATRDEVLGDLIPKAVKEAANVELATVFHLTKGQPNRVIVRREKQGKYETLLKYDLEANQPAYGDLAGLAEIAEALSRTQFPAVLAQLGANGKAIPAKPDADQPQGTEEKLAHLGFLEPFLAIREIHRAIKIDGESPERLGALVRAYALLGILTEHHWHPAHKVFKARALLYAQRLVAHDPKGAFGLFHRAYAFALIGVHANALSDLNLARKSAKAGGEPAPPWAAVIEAYCGYDVPRMNLEKGPLAALLRMMIVEYPTMTDLTLLSAKDVLTLDPECYRAHDTMCAVGGVINLHEATTVGPQILAQTLPVKIPAIESISRVVRSYFDDPKGGEPALFAAFSEAGAVTDDAGEPSWSVLGRLIQETRFVQVCRGLQFLRGPLGAPTDQFWTQSVPAISTHPYRSYLETLLRRPRDAGGSLTELVEHLDLANVQMSSFSMIAAIHRSGVPRGQVPWNLAWKHMDNNAHDFAEFVQAADGLDKPAAALSLLEISPRSPLAKAVLIEKDWDRARTHLAEWERDADSSPAILAALARRYTELGKAEEANRALARYIRFSPDQWAYEQIANNYKAAGDLAKWQSTLEEFIAKTEDHALSHAQVRVELARHFMELKQWEKAWPFARAAAESSGAQWAYMCATDCAIERKDWEPAEGFAERNTRRYTPQAWGYWFLFCIETGHGNLAGAREFAVDYLKPINDQPNRAAPGPVGYFYWLSGDSKTAMIWFRNAYTRTPGPYTCFNLILLADEIGDSATRDEMIRVLLSQYRRLAPVACRIYEVLRKGLDENKPGSVDLKAIDEILAKAAPGSRGLNAWLAGMFLKNHGKPEASERYLKLALDSPGVPEWGKAKAIATLRSLGKHDPAEKPGPGPKN